MSRNNIILLCGAVLVLLACLFYLANRSTQQRWNWNVSLSEDSVEPYGTKVLYDIFKKEGRLRSVKEGFGNVEFSDTLANYFSVRRYVHRDSASIQNLFDFVREGNTAFMNVQGVPDTVFLELGSYYFKDYALDFTRTKTELFNFTEEPFAMEQPFPLFQKWRDKKTTSLWVLLDTTELSWMLPGNKVHGFSESGANLVSVDYGSGRFYFFTTPISFTNYFMIEPDGKDYASRVLSHLNDGPIYWDNTQFSWAKPTGNDQPVTSPLRYIISQPSLRWAWYILLAGALFYVIFRTKRRQASIPILAKKENSSMEYVNTIAGLHYSESADHKLIADMLISQFNAFIRERYHLSTSRQDENFTENLSARSGVEASSIAALIKIIKSTESSGKVADYELLRLHRHIQEFMTHPDVMPKQAEEALN